MDLEALLFVKGGFWDLRILRNGPMSKMDRYLVLVVSGEFLVGFKRAGADCSCYQIGTSPVYESERAPFQVRVSLSTYFNLADFADPMAHVQREVTDIMKGNRRQKGIKKDNFPGRLMVDTPNDPARPQPNCKHAEIDMKSPETSRVVRYGQCIWGRTEHRSYQDGRLMSEQEFEDWKERTGATYSKENQSDE
jgi:hypothetical protein